MLGWVVLLGIGFILAMVLYQKMDRRQTISPQQFWRYAKNGDLTGTLIIREKEIEGQLKDSPGMRPDEPRKFVVNYAYAQADDNFDERLEKALQGSHGVSYRYEFTGWWETLLPHLLILALVFLAVWFFLFRRLGAAASGGGFLGSFGRSRHRVLSKEHTNVTFTDVAGIEEAKDEVTEIIEFLKNPRKFQRLGGRIPRGVLLVGEPG